MAEPVRVFVSHSHKDDEFTLRLVGDLRASGADVWVDTAEIRYDDFLRKINEGLSGRQWLVLVMTPDALTSRYVQMEVNAALHQVIEGRMRAVIPVLAKPCALADIPITWAPLHRYDATRDYAAGLAGLRQAMGLAAPAAPPAAAKPAPAPAAPVQAPKPAAPASTSQPPTRVVDQSGKGEYRTISDAVKAAQPGDRILVRPGTYRESIEIRKPIEVVGDGNRDQIILQATGGDAILCRVEGAKVANLTLRQAQPRSNSALVFYGGRLVVENCDCSNSTGMGFRVASETDLTVRRSRIHDCKDYGIFLSTGAKATLVDNDIVNNRGSGVTIMTDAVAVVRSSRITGNQNAAIWVNEKGSCIAEDNDLRGNSGGAIYAAPGAKKVQRARNLE